MNPVNSASRIVKRTALALIVMMSLVVLLIFILLGHYAHPSADDFCMATGVGQDGLILHLWHHYLEWSGRYAGNAFYAVYLMAFGISDGYQLMPVLLILSLVLATAYFLASLFRISIRTPTIMLVSLYFVTVYLLGMRDTASSLYWTAGALTYQTANILLLCMLGLIIRLIDHHRETKKTTGIFITLLAVIVLSTGTHETNMLVVTTILGSLFVFNLRSVWSIKRLWLFMFLTAILGASIVYYSPGNSIRGSTFPLQHIVSQALGGSLNMGFRTLGIWLGSPLLIISTLLTPFAVSSLYRSSERTMNVSKSLILALIVITLGVPFVLQFPAWWAMGGWPPARTVDAIYFVFLLCWFSTISAITIRYIGRSNRSSRSNPDSPYLTTALSIGAIIFIAAVGSNSKFLRATNDLLHRAKPFHEYMLMRHMLIDEAVAKEQLFLAVPEYGGKYPRSIYFNDIRQDPRDWRNVCYADYFGLQGISRSKARGPG